MTQIGSEEWLTLVQDAAAQLGVTVHRQQARQFARHALWLMEWNRKINLTRITDPRQVAIKHYVDAIAPLPHIPEDGHLLDIGTGGGFPGIPLKIMRPGQPMTLIDSVRKKINFLRHVIRQMPLEGVEALQTRAESLANEVSPSHLFDIIVCRALSEPLAAMAMAKPLLASGGKIILYRGPGTSGKINASHQVAVDGVVFLQTVITFTLPYTHFSRRIDILDCQS